MTTRAAVHRRDGRRVPRFADDDFVQTRYNLRTADERYDTRDEDDYDYEQAGRRKASRPSPRVGQRRARSPSPVYARASTGRGSARRRETGPDTAMAKRGTAMTKHRPVEDYVTHPLDDFDRYMLARRERGARPREHMRPAAREMERIAYMDSRRRGRPHEEEEEGQDQADEDRYSGDFSEDDVDYDRFRVQRQRHRDRGEQDYGEVRRGRQIIRRSDLVQRGSGGRDRRYEGEEEEGEEGEEGYDYDDAGLEMYQGESDEGEGLVSASDALDEDEEYITGRRMPLRSKRRLHDYDEDDAAAVRRAYTGRRMPQQQQHKRRRRDEEEQEEEDRGLTFTVGDEDLEEEEEQRRPTGRRRTRAQEAEEEEEGGGAEDVQQRRQGRKLSSRQTHRHPTYEDMIAEALVKVGKNGKASGVAIFKYVHDHFDMPANDRLVRNHLHQAFERLIDSGQLRHKKASYVLPRNLLAQYDAKYGAKKDEEKENKEEGEKGPEGGGEADQGGDQVAQKEGQEGGAASEKQATEGVAPSSDKGASAGERQQQQHEKKASEEKADKSEETTTALTSKKAGGGGGRKRSR